MFTYTAKSVSLATDFRTAAKFLASHGIKATVKGPTLKTEATPGMVSHAIAAGYLKYGF